MFGGDDLQLKIFHGVGLAGIHGNHMVVGQPVVADQGLGGLGSHEDQGTIPLREISQIQLMVKVGVGHQHIVRPLHLLQGVAAGKAVLEKWIDEHPFPPGKQDLVGAAGVERPDFHSLCKHKITPSHIFSL